MFSVASEDVLKNRAIKKAKRRNIGSEVKPEPENSFTLNFVFSYIDTEKDMKRFQLFQAESTGAFKGFKGFSLAMSAASGGSTAVSGFGNGGGFKGLGGLTNGNSITSSFGGFSSPATSSASPGGNTVTTHTFTGLRVFIGRRLTKWIKVTMNTVRGFHFTVTSIMT